MQEITITNLDTGLTKDFSNIEGAIDYCRENKFKDYLVDVTFWDLNSVDEQDIPDIIGIFKLEEIKHDINKYGFFDPSK